MDNIVYDSLTKYFNTLSLTGYVSDKKMYDVLFLTIIRKIVYQYFPSRISKEDYTSIERALYNIFGNSYLIPYPQFTDLYAMNKLHLEDMTDFLNSVDHRIDEGLREVRETKVLKSEDSGEITVDDIII
jgi:hypothetical protein